MHYEWSVKALEAGKHVLCEKPFTRHVDEVEHAFDVARERGLILAEAFMWRHNPLLSRARELIAEGAIGQLRLVRAVFSFVLADEGDVRFSKALDGGALMDLGCYCVSGCRALTGAEPETFAAEQVQGGDGVDLSTAGVMRFPGDVLATIDCSFGMTPRDELEAIGTEGSLFIDSPWHANPATIEVRKAGGIEHLEIGQNDSYALEIEDFEAAVAREREPLLGRADALGQARAISALYEAAGKGL
jgi:predicted dehydrogenase